MAKPFNAVMQKSSNRRAKQKARRARKKARKGKMPGRTLPILVWVQDDNMPGRVLRNPNDLPAPKEDEDNVCGLCAEKFVPEVSPSDTITRECLKARFRGCECAYPLCNRCYLVNHKLNCRFWTHPVTWEEFAVTSCVGCRRPKIVPTWVIQAAIRNGDI